MMKRHVLGLALLVSGCSAAIDDDSQVTGKTGAKADSFTAPVDWFTCRAASVDGGVAVTCETHDTPPPVRVVAGAVSLRDGAGTRGHMLVSDTKTPQTVTLAGARFPVEANLEVFLVVAGDGASALNGLSSVKQDVVLAADGANVVIKQPFQVWAITLLTDEQLVAVETSKHDIPLGDLVDADGKSTFTCSPESAFGAPDQPGRLFVALPFAATSLDVDVTHDGLTHRTVTLDGPGGWRINADSVRKEELPAEPTDSPDPTDSPEPTMSPEPTVSPEPAMPPEPAPTCGTDNQSPCSGTSCAEGFVYQSWNQQCHACGREREPRCDDGCAPGFVYEDWNQQCHACGRDRQPRCDNGCDPGFVYEDWNQQCHAA
jgi:hypothetical protein